MSSRPALPRSDPASAAPALSRPSRTRRSRVGAPRRRGCRGDPSVHPVPAQTMTQEAGRQTRWKALRRARVHPVLAQPDVPAACGVDRLVRPGRVAAPKQSSQDPVVDKQRHSVAEPGSGHGPVVLGEPASQPAADSASAGRPQLDDRQAPVYSRQRRVRPHRELDSTNDKSWFVLDSGKSAVTEQRDTWPVCKGASFNLWQPDTGVYYASVEAHRIITHLHEKRARSHRHRASPFSEFPTTWIDDPETLPCRRPRIAFRDVTNRTNTGTVIAALVPADLVVTDQAPYLLWPRRNSRDEAYVLGVLSSMILDWFARCTVETHVTFHLLNNFPIPDADVVEDPVARRIIEIAGRLAAVDERYAEWAAEVGMPVGSVTDEESKQDLICELDACVAHLYGLDEEDLGRRVRDLPRGRRLLRAPPGSAHPLPPMGSAVTTFSAPPKRTGTLSIREH